MKAYINGELVDWPERHLDIFCNINSFIKEPYLIDENGNTIYNYRSQNQPRTKKNLKKTLMEWSRRSEEKQREEWAKLR